MVSHSGILHVFWGAKPPTFTSGGSKAPLAPPAPPPLDQIFDAEPVIDYRNVHIKHLILVTGSAIEPCDER